MKIRSMRDIPTIQGLARRSRASNREQAVNEMARLEHEKARLERELAVWVKNQQRTEERLRLVVTRLEQVAGQLNNEAEGGAKAQRTAPQPEPQEWESFSLEY